ncbi:uncharacterized protein [Montipora foliosa]|uniref:uncharacterized protein isoform X2 n=1 Tax=Montipora foliosa TaxID=591990 RepID=UPI0035F1AEC5
MFRSFPDKKPFIWQVGVVVTIMFAATQFTAASKHCGMSQYSIYDPKNPKRTLKCEDCPKCPPGMGVPVQCGRWKRVPNGTTINCEQCKPNKTFSNTDDSSMCSSCNECQKQIVLHQCTLTQDRKCGRSCPPKHFLDPHLDDCKECFFCCPSSQENTRMEECKALGLPSNEWCEATEENKLCKENHRSHVDETNITGTIKPTANSSIGTEWKSNNTNITGTIKPTANSSIGTEWKSNNTNITGTIKPTASSSIGTEWKSNNTNITGTIKPTASSSIGTEWKSNNTGSKVITTGIIHSNNSVSYPGANYTDGADKTGNSNYLLEVISTSVCAAALFVLVVSLIYIYKKYFQKHSGSTSRKKEYASVEQGENVEMDGLQKNLAHNSGGDLDRASVSPNPSTNVSNASSFESVHMKRNEASSDNNPTNDGMECLCQANPAQQNVGFDIERIPEDCVISEMEKLRKGTEKGCIDVMIFQVQKKLDSRETPQRKTWRSVGLALDVDPEDLALILTQPGSPTDSILEYFKTLGAREPKMRTFVQALIVCRREDLAGIICNWPYDDFQNTHRQAH